MSGFRDAAACRLAKELRLYAVTDRTWLGGRELAECVQQVIAGGATFVQLREKHLDQVRSMQLARSLKSVCAQADVPFVIDDDIEAARAVDADGVHLGQADVACKTARMALGFGKIIGVSVRTVDEALKAEQDGADYLGVGALFPTSTKADAVDVSLDDLRAICAAVSIPVVGIGGLDEQTIPALRGSGACGAAIVSALFASEDCESSARKLRAVVDRAFGQAGI
jgi:thiamine-phosphate pyrophosphorylase